MADYSSEISFNCPECGEDVETIVPVPEPNWVEDKAVDRVTTDEIEVECPECREDFVADVTNCDGSITIEFCEYPAVEVECGHGHDRSPDVEWDDIPESPASEFRSSVGDAMSLLSTSGWNYGPSPINRMVFIHCFSAFEAFLADTLIQNIKRSREAMVRLLSSEKNLKVKKISLADVFKDSDIVMKEVAAYFGEMSYHKVHTVRDIYQTAFEFDIFPSDEIGDALARAIPLRHNCVHRNGRDKAGNESSELVANYVRETAGYMTAMVNYNDGRLSPS